MRTVVVSFDLKCKKTVDSIGYRVYINDELMTERDFIWEQEYIREHVPLKLEKGVHVLEIQNLNELKGEFSINNFTVDNKPQPLFNGREFKI